MFTWGFKNPTVWAFWACSNTLKFWRFWPPVYIWVKKVKMVTVLPHLNFSDQKDRNFGTFVLKCTQNSKRSKFWQQWCKKYTGGLKTTKTLALWTENLHGGGLKTVKFWRFWRKIYAGGQNRHKIWPFRLKTYTGGLKSVKVLKFLSIPVYLWSQNRQNARVFEPLPGTC